MSDLYPTPRRLSILRMTADGEIRSAIGGAYTPFGAKVTGTMRDMRSAGWVDHERGARLWHITDAGRAILDGAS